MTHITCRLTAKNWDRLQKPTLGKRVLATFFYTGESKSVTIILHSVDTIMSHVNKLDIVAAVRVCHSGSTNGSVTLDYICMTTLVA